MTVFFTDELKTKLIPECFAGDPEAALQRLGETVLFRATVYGGGEARRSYVVTGGRSFDLRVEQDERTGDFYVTEAP